MDGVLERGDGPGMFALAGDIGFHNVRQLWEQGLKEFHGSKEIAVNLAGVERTDSAGVALLIGWVREASNAGRSIRFDRVPDQIHAIATVCGVASILPLGGGPTETAVR